MQPTMRAARIDGSLAPGSRPIQLASEQRPRTDCPDQGWRSVSPSRESVDPPPVSGIAESVLVNSTLVWGKSPAQ